MELDMQAVSRRGFASALLVNALDRSVTRTFADSWDISVTQSYPYSRTIQFSQKNPERDDSVAERLWKEAMLFT